MANPLPNFGLINKLITSVSFPSYSALALTAAFMGPEGVKLAPEGQAAELLPVLAGAVPSPNPFLILTVTMDIVRTVPVASAYKAQFESSTQLGDCVIRTDASTFPVFDLSQCILRTVREIDSSGRQPTFGVEVQGVWYINSSLWG